VGGEQGGQGRDGGAGLGADLGEGRRAGGRAELLDLLVRPDGIVAWDAPAGAAAGESPDAVAELTAALAQWFAAPALR
jgi:hypothetical protein